VIYANLRVKRAGDLVPVIRSIQASGASLRQMAAELTRRGITAAREGGGLRFRSGGCWSGYKQNCNPRWTLFDLTEGKKRSRIRRQLVLSGEYKQSYNY
jgi:hypothetical protein